MKYIRNSFSFLSSLLLPSFSSAFPSSFSAEGWESIAKQCPSETIQTKNLCFGQALTDLDTPSEYDDKKNNDFLKQVQNDNKRNKTSEFVIASKCEAIQHKINAVLLPSGLPRRAYALPAMTAKKGFTLIELLVIVLIIGIIAAIAFPYYRVAILKSQASQGLSIIRSITAAQKIHHITYNKYATNLDALDITFPDYKLCAGNGSNGSNNYYSNGKIQIVMSTDGWYIGYSTQNAACTATYRGPMIIGLLPGGYAGSCPSTDKDICIMCLAAGQDKYHKQACESLGGKYMGVFNTHSMYKFN